MSGHKDEGLDLLGPDAPDDAGLLMGDLDFIAPDEVKHNTAALRKWREVTKIFKEAGLTVVSSTDCGVIGRYCMLYAEYWALLKERKAISDFELPDDDMQEIMAITEFVYERDRGRRLWGVVEYFTRLKGLLELDRAINAKQKAILDVEDRIFLNPAAKARKLAIKKRAAKVDPLEKLGFKV